MKSSKTIIALAIVGLLSACGSDEPAEKTYRLPSASNAPFAGGGAQPAPKIALAETKKLLPSEYTEIKTAQEFVGFTLAQMPGGEVSQAAATSAQPWLNGIPDAFKRDEATKAAQAHLTTWAKGFKGVQGIMIASSDGRSYGLGHFISAYNMQSGTFDIGTLLATIQEFNFKNAAKDQSDDVNLPNLRLDTSRLQAYRPASMDAARAFEAERAAGGKLRDFKYKTYMQPTGATWENGNVIKLLVTRVEVIDAKTGEPVIVVEAK